MRDKRNLRGNLKCSKMTRTLLILSFAFVGIVSNAWAQTQPVTVEETAEGTILRGTKLAPKLDWLPRNAESHNTYIIEVTANENVAPRTLEFKDAINITIILRGDSINRILRLASNGIMFTVNANVTFVLDSNITLQGHSQNTGPMVKVDGGGIFKMNAGSTITGNSNTGRVDGGGIHVWYGIFEMNGGTISNNISTNGNGGGVYFSQGTFEMKGGTISGNTATNGGGIYSIPYVAASITINAGTITGNTANNEGGGVYVGNTVIVNDGIISENTAAKGGGVSSSVGGNFIMRGGTITGNTATEYGGGVYVYAQRSSFSKTSNSIITGYNSDKTNGNVVRDKEGVLARRGHAVYNDKSSNSNRKETTSGIKENLSSGSSENWDE